MEDDLKNITVEMLVKKFDEADDLTCEARKWSEKSRDYYDGNQYTAAELAVFEQRQQPPTINNRIAPMVDFLLGIELRSRTDPKVYPRSMSETADKDAEAATDSIRFVLDNNFFDNLASEVFETFLIEGPGGVSVEVEKRGKEREIVIRKIPFNRLIFDPYSVERQKKDDCTYTGIVAWLDLAEIKGRWPDADIEKIKEGAYNASRFTRRGQDTYDDVPRWYDQSDRHRVMVVDMYFKHNGKWHHAIFAKDSFLTKPEVSTYKDEFGEPENPHIIACPKISREGDHYGPVKNKLSIQDDINRRHSRSTDLLNRRQTFAKEGMITDIRKFKQESNASGGHIEFPAGPGEFGKDFGFIPNENLGMVEHEMFKDAITQIESLARAGIASDNETNMSGKALGKLQTSRNLEIQPLVEVHSMWKIRVYRAIWNRIRQFWTKERWIRVTDDESNVRFVGLNRQTTFEDLAKQRFGGRIPPELADDPRLKQPVRAPDGTKPMTNKVSEIDVDIFIEEVPDIVSLREETFEQLVSLYQANPEAVPFDKIIKLAPLRSKEREELLGPKEPSPQEIQQQQAAQQEQQELIDLEKQTKAVKIAKEAAEAGKKKSEKEQTDLENRLLESFPIQPTNLSI